MAAALDRIDRVRHFPSEANFILIRVPDAGQTFERLQSRKILVKNTGNSHPLLSNTLRLTVGTPAENDALIAALEVSI